MSSFKHEVVQEVHY